MLCFEWWVFELLAIFSGLMSVEALAAEVVIVNLVTFIFMFPLGTSYAASALTGVFLGEGKIESAKKYARLTLLFNVFVTIVIVVVLLTAHRGIAHLFTHDAKVVGIIDDVLGMLVLYVFFDTIHGVQSGIIRGLGLQVYGAIWTLICYYPIGLTLALCFAFKRGMGVYGLWLGFAIACIILDIGLLVICECANWSDIARDIQKNIDGTQKKKIEDASEHLSNEDYAGAAVARTPEGRRFIR
jgi:MATE family multidrug resistance protein